MSLHNPDTDKLEVTAVSARAAPEASKKETPKTAGQKLFPLSAGELGPPSSPDYVIKGLINRGDFTIIYGKAGCGKSLFTADVAFRVSQRSERIYGRRVRGGPVLYVCLEGQRGFRLRIKALEDEHGTAKELYLIEQPFSLSEAGSEAFVTELIEHAKKLGVVMIVIDTWAQATAGGDENGSEAGGRALASINRLRTETNAVVVCIDHTGWSEDAQKRPRGWSGKWAASDTALRLDGDIKKGDVVVVPERLKDGTDFESLVFGSEKVELGVDEDGDPIESFRAIERSESELAKIASRRDRKGGSLTAKEAGDLDVIVSSLAKLGQDYDASGYGVVNAVTRDALYSAFREAQRVADNASLQRDKGRDTERKSGAEREAMRRRLMTLKDKEKIDFDRAWVWSTINIGAPSGV
ncbi:hypothetical protein GCM10011367_17330 [Marinicauda pacifica]|uniref:AAA family ATPase n=1 Tax=Marinicauda pacifica TaxID=1133559 RepID=A0A4S2HBR9_9PROT|nr:AAA family ATPase [Marinicauda pacifica]TGY93138.1 AAA family ATPase [Marinicauda pacifica]GGE43178.1 hypothetical protein GCM10011367_17330 [Marinicauda pacifica]